MITTYRNTESTTLFGLSTDSKPTVGIANGTIFYEMDSGSVYMFNEASGTWVLQ